MGTNQPALLLFVERKSPLRAPRGSCTRYTEKKAILAAPWLVALSPATAIFLAFSCSLRCVEFVLLPKLFPGGVRHVTPQRGTHTHYYYVMTFKGRPSGGEAGILPVGIPPFYRRGEKKGLERKQTAAAKRNLSAFFSCIWWLASEFRLQLTPGVVATTPTASSRCRSPKAG